MSFYRTNTYVARLVRKQCSSHNGSAAEGYQRPTNQTIKPNKQTNKTEPREYTKKNKLIIKQTIKLKNAKHQHFVVRR